MQKCVSGIIMNENGEVLVQKHMKVQRYTLPGGKVDPNEYEKTALIREMLEELGIMVYRYEELFTAKFENIEYPANSGNYTNFHHVYYSINAYEGEVVNKEPEKHPELLWVKPENIRDLGPISVVLNRYLEFINL